MKEKSPVSIAKKSYFCENFKGKISFQQKINKMNLPYTIQITEEEVAFVVFTDNLPTQTFINQYDGYTYEGPYERFWYLLPTDVFAETSQQGNQHYLLVKNWKEEVFFRFEISQNTFNILTSKEEEQGIMLIFSKNNLPKHKAEAYFSFKEIEEIDLKMNAIEQENSWEAYSLWGYFIKYFSAEEKKKFQE